MIEVPLSLPSWNPKQKLAFETEATDLLFGGATRGGKSFFVRKAYIIWCSQIPGLQCDIFRLHFDDVIAENMEGDTSFPALLDPWTKAGLVKINQAEIKFWNGSSIYLEHCANDRVMLKHQGIARHVRTFSESTQIGQRRILWLGGWVTMSEEMLARVPEKWKGRFPKKISVTNPLGESAGFYRRAYVEARPQLAIEVVGSFKRQYIEARVEDNRHENPETTRARISQIGDKAVADALLNANWNALAGEFFPEWDEERHVVTDFYPPHWWFRFRTYDWGVSDPSVCYWVAVSDGEPFKDHNGNERWFPRGALIFYQELYFCDAEDPSKGARLTNLDMANAILDMSEGHAKKVPTLTDSKPFQSMGGYGIEETFRDAGVPLTRADTSRVAGWAQMRARLRGVQIDSNDPRRIPMVFFTECCKKARDYIPALPRHPSEAKKEDAAEHGEASHSADSIRYACMVHNVIKDCVLPLETRIAKELSSNKPTIKRLTKRAGHSYF